MLAPKSNTFPAYLRHDGTKGIRNIVLVVYTVECSHHVAREIVMPFREHDVHLIGFSGCAPSAYANFIIQQLCTHSNVAAVLLISHGCENLDIKTIHAAIKETGRPVKVLTIQQEGGTTSTIQKGRNWIETVLRRIKDTVRIAMSVDELIVGTICGGSDATSGITANPAVGRVFDRLVADGATCLFEETGELIGCEFIMAQRAANPQLGGELIASVQKAAAYYKAFGHGSFSAGNAVGGLTTIEEKSMGAYSKSGGSEIKGILKPGQKPPGKGLYLLDVVPDGEPKWASPNPADNSEIMELIACGCHLFLFTTARGSVVGSAISPVIKVCAHPITYRNMSEDMDANGGAILEGKKDLDQVAEEIYQKLINVCSGAQSASEVLFHQEYAFSYKYFDYPENVCPFC